MFMKNFIRSSMSQWIVAVIPPFYFCFYAPIEYVVEKSASKQYFGSWASEQAENAYNDVLSYFWNVEQPEPEPKPEPTFQEIVLDFFDENQMVIFNVILELIMFEVARYIYNHIIKKIFCSNDDELVFSQSKFLSLSP